MFALDTLIACNGIDYKSRGRRRDFYTLLVVGVYALFAHKLLTLPVFGTDLPTSSNCTHQAGVK